MHGNQCSTCHPTPYDTLSGSWSGGCQQGGCHTTYHDGPYFGHWDAEDANQCNQCHPVSWDPRPQDCLNCHATPASASPPVTTSDAAASYDGAGNIRFSITKAGKVAVGTTYYKIDGGATATGSSVLVTAPGAHTLEFWSVDQNGLTETIHKTANYTIVADTTPPSTTSNAQPAYWTNALITLTATDASTLGVKATYYILDGGATKTGTSISIAKPASGTVTHTLVFWSVDWSGNVESQHSVSFDMTGGTGTIRLVWGSSDTGSPPGPGTAMAWTIRRGTPGGTIVSTGSAAYPWSGVNNVVLPVSNQPYFVTVDWDDPDWYVEWDQTYFPNIYLSTDGQVVRLSY